MQQLLVAGASRSFGAMDLALQAAMELPPNPFRDAVILVFESYQRTGSIEASCKEADAFLQQQADDASQASEASLLKSLGYRTERFDNYCPW